MLLLFSRLNELYTGGRVRKTAVGDETSRCFASWPASWFRAVLHRKEICAALLVARKPQQSRKSLCRHFSKAPFPVKYGTVIGFKAEIFHLQSRSFRFFCDRISSMLILQKRRVSNLTSPVRKLWSPNQMPTVLKTRSTPNMLAVTPRISCSSLDNLLNLSELIRQKSDRLHLAILGSWYGWLAGRRRRRFWIVVD